MSMLKNKQSRPTTSVFRQFISFVIVAVFVLQHLLIIFPTTAKSAASKSLLLVDLIPSVAVNKYQNTGTAADILELLVIQNNLDMRGMIIKDFSASMVNDTGGKFQFTTNTLWSSVPAGTLIVLRNNNTAADVTVGGGDFNVDIGLQNTTYFSNLGGTFDIATTDLLMIKAAGSDSAGVTGSIHVLAGGTAGAQFTAAPTPKLRATGTSGTNQFVYANNSTQSIADFDGTDATGAATGLIFGSGNNANNTAFINSLRSGGPITTNPSGNGSAAPNAVLPGENTTLTVTVTPGTNPASSGITVTADLTAIGGSAAQALSGSGNTFTYQATVAAGTTAGVKNLPFTVADSEGRSSSGSISLTVNSPGGVVDHIVISQVYGGGGNANASYSNDFVELYNPTNATVNLTGWSLQYASATGSGWDGSKQPLGGIIGPGEYYLVSLGTSNSTIGQPLPAANISGELNLSGTAGKIALVSNGDSLSGNCPLSDPDLVDFVGYGTTADCSEGDVDAPAPSSANSIFRKSNGAQDTNVNGSDFLAQSASPRRTAPIVEIGPSVLSTDPRNDFTNTPRDSSLIITFTEPIYVDPQWFTVNCVVTGAHNDATIASYNNGKSYVITPNVNFQAGENCSVTISKDSVHDQDLDDSAPNSDTLTANYSWSFTIATGTAPAYPPDVHLTMGNPSDAVADISMPNNYLMMKPEFALSYNRDRGTPNWVSWHLDDTWVGTLTRVDTFRPDPAVPSEWYRVLASDYFGSGFDRGHMVPNADRDKETSSPINQATFLMTNILPQAPDNNQGPWANMENALRNDYLPANELYIISGGAGTGGSGSNGGITTTIADGKVTVPAFTWKVALILPKADGDDIARVSSATRTLAVIMPNSNTFNGSTIRDDDWRSFLVSIDEVEELTGYDFYENLPDAVENSVEAGIDGNNPPGAANQIVNVAEGGSVSITLQAAGSGNLTYEILTQPTNGSIAAGTGATRSYTPTSDYNGTDSFTFRASDGTTNSNVATITINVTEVNDAPVASVDSKTTPFETALTFAATDLTANDNAGAANESGQTLTVTQVMTTAQTHGTVSLSSGQITYTPETGYSGSAAFDYQVCDNGTTAGAPDVKCVNGSVNVSVGQAASYSISGTVSYGTTPSGDPAKLVPDVTLTAAGTPQVSATTNSVGAYLLNGLSAGGYTITPSKAAQTDINGISLQDASEVAKYVFNQRTFTPNQLIAADATGDGTVSLQDASEIAKRSFNIAGTNIVGQWKFVPASKTYASVSSNLTGENYEAILVGDVTGNWTPPNNPTASKAESETQGTEKTLSAFEQSEQQPSVLNNSVFLAPPTGKNHTAEKSAAAGVTVVLPTAQGNANTTVLIPVTVGDLTGLNVTAYDFTVAFDPLILQPASPAFETAGTRTDAAGGYSVFVDPGQPSGKVRIGAFGTVPLSGSGTLIFLRFTVLAGAAATSPLNFDNFTFGEGTPGDKTANGTFNRLGPTAAAATITGRVLSASGRAVSKAKVLLTAQNGEVKTAITNPFGYYRFNDIPAGGTYTITVNHKGYIFLPQVINVGENIGQLIITAQP